jgi:hypothetical protein
MNDDRQHPLGIACGPIDRRDTARLAARRA